MGRPRKDPKSIDGTLVAAVSKMLNAAMKDAKMPLADKLRVIDRALKLEALKQRVQNDDWGKGFHTNNEEDAVADSTVDLDGGDDDDE